MTIKIKRQELGAQAVGARFSTGTCPAPPPTAPAVNSSIKLKIGIFKQKQHYN